MANIKPTNEQLQKLYKHREWLVKETKSLTIRAENSDTDFGKDLIRSATENFEQTEQLLDNYEVILKEGGHDKLISVLESRRQQKFFRDYLKNARENILRYEKKLMEINSEIKEYERKLDAL